MNEFLKLLILKLKFPASYIEIFVSLGQQPRYLGDAKRGTQSTVASPTEPRIPPIMPRAKHRNDKASSTPPSPRSSQNGHFTTPSPPPLYPRKLSTQEQLAPPPPLKVLTHGVPDLNGPVPPHSAPFCATPGSIISMNVFNYPLLLNTLSYITVYYETELS